MTPARVSYYVRSRDATTIERTAALNHERAEADRHAALNLAAYEERLAHFAEKQGDMSRNHGIFLDEPALERFAELFSARNMDHYQQLRPGAHRVVHLAAEVRMWDEFSRDARYDLQWLMRAYSEVKMGRWDLEVWDRATKAGPEGRAERERRTKSRFAKRRLSGALGVARVAKKLKQGKRKSKAREDEAEEDESCSYEGKGKDRQWE